MFTCSMVITHYGQIESDRLKRTWDIWQKAGIAQLYLLGPRLEPPIPEMARVIETDKPLSAAAWNELIAQIPTDGLIHIDATQSVQLETEALHRFRSVMAEASVTWLYSDYWTESPQGLTLRPTIDYQLGGIRDDFHFGPVQVINMAALRMSLDRDGLLLETDGSALYELRLRLSERTLPLRIPEPLYIAGQHDRRPTGQQNFDYVDPRNRTVQIEREWVAGEHLKRINAFLEPFFLAVPDAEKNWPVQASVIIPVRNREKTIRDAVESALTQRADFPFNVLVVDNHSSDKTGAILEQMGQADQRVVRLVPQRKDLGIGGCWHYAVQSPECGRYAVQLDSDDLYAAPDVLRLIVETLQSGPYAMVVGAYKLVNFDLEEIPPGVIDHREWTRDNGRNNALRINGLGAPRAFDTAILRQIGVPNVSYGEDYAVGLRISREYDIGRIYDPIYLCRRWEDNSDADLPVEVKNRHDIYKDRLRTLEILARQQINRSEAES